MNPLLILIGVSLFALSCILILTGSFYRKKTVSKSSTKPKFSDGVHAFIPLRLPYDSKIEGVISVAMGELYFSLENFFGWIPPAQFTWLSPSYESWKGHGKYQFQRKLNFGDYVFMFRKESEQEVSAEIHYEVTYFIPQLRRLVDLGLAFVEVSVPLLVTGLVL